MARTAAQYVCQDCGALHGKWTGHCDGCGAWNSVVEEVPTEAVPKGLGAGRGQVVPFVPLDGVSADAPRRNSGIAEFDRVTGGGLVPGSGVLIGGDPGIGKSTLVLQVVGRMAASFPCAYISGEEAIDQVRMRAARLGLENAPVQLASATNVRDIMTTLDVDGGPAVVVIDSIQTMYVDALESAPGSVAQVRASAQELVRLAKRRGFTVLLVGHVTKEGAIAGPRVLEHMVDTVLYFEGERGHQFRLLRAIKNRYGPTDEIGVFEMTDSGLMEVANPSELFLAERRRNVSGSAVFAGIEGTRPLLVEIQALVAPSALATPRRAVVGWDSARLAMVLAVLDVRIGEPAADLAVAGAILSAVGDRPAPEGTVMFGEIGLSGEVRGVGQTPQRLKEAAKLGFVRAMTPLDSARRPATEAGIEIREIVHLRDLLAPFGCDADTLGAIARPEEVH